MNTTTRNSEKEHMNALGVSPDIAIDVGRRLGDARRQQALSPTKLSHKIKIREKYISAIEEGDWDTLPPGLNGRGLVRIYARELGVSIPEFESFQQNENQSSMATSWQVQSKSRYRPASEETLEIIRSIPRDEFHKNTSSQNSHSLPVAGSQVSSDSIGTMAPVPPPRGLLRSSAASGIPTPDVYDVLGLGSSQTSTSLSSSSIETKKSVQDKENTLSSSHLQEDKKKEEFGDSKVIPLHFDLPPHTSEARANSIDKDSVSTESLTHFISQPSSSTKKETTEGKHSEKKKNIGNSVLLAGIAALVTVGIYLLASSYQGWKNFFSLTYESSQETISEPVYSSFFNKSFLSSTSSGRSFLSTHTQSLLIHQEDTSFQYFLRLPANVIHVPNRVAIMDIQAPVRIEVDIDGQQVFAGIKTPGSFEISFKNHADVTVFDASRATLTYGNWKKSTLGHPGRKRRIALNSLPFTDDE